MTRDELDVARAALDREWAAFDKFLRGFMWACAAFLVLYPVACAVIASS